MQTWLVPVLPIPNQAVHARHGPFLPEFALQTLTEPLSAVPVLVIAVLGKRKVTLRFLAGVDRATGTKPLSYADVGTEQELQSKE